MASLPSQSAEDYLERIHELIEEKGYARVVDIASSLDVKQASVTSMVQKLGELGYLNYEKYRGLIFTDKGRAWRVSFRSDTKRCHGFSRSWASMPRRSGRISKASSITSARQRWPCWLIWPRFSKRIRTC